MIVTKVRITRFKKFKDNEFKLKPGVSLIAGANNSGKSSLLHTLAIWEFCKRILLIERKAESFHTHTGVGVSFEDFTPLNVPSYKHLWTNLKSQKSDKDTDGYTLRIRVSWLSDEGVKIVEPEYHLEFGLSLANDRLFIKPIDTNILESEWQSIRVPTFGYLPPFAGITDKEPKYTPAMRRRLLGQGLSGAVIRNMILNMYEQNQEKRKKLKGDKKRLPSRELKRLRAEDPYELLLRTIQDIFRRSLKVRPFNEEYHAYIKIESFAGEYNEKGLFRKYPDYNPRDIMVEGSGFLQWLSVYTLALSAEIDALLLDEADAHLHSSLQTALIERLRSLVNLTGRQVLFATHSSEIIKSMPPENILHLRNNESRYLTTEDQKVALLHGIGSTYTPKLYELQRNKRLLFVESEFDERLLRMWAEILSIEWPDNLVIWHWSGGHKERKALFIQLQREMPGLIALSIRDRDDEPIETVGANLEDKAHQEVEGLKMRKWKRRTIENYLLCKQAIARASGKQIAEIETYFSDAHSISLPATENVILHNVVSAIADARAKQIFITDSNSIKKVFGISREDVAKKMQENEIPVDIRILLAEIKTMCE